MQISSVLETVRSHWSSVLALPQYRPTIIDLDKLKDCLNSQGPLGESTVKILNTSGKYEALDLFGATPDLQIVAAVIADALYLAMKQNTGIADYSSAFVEFNQTFQSAGQKAGIFEKKDKFPTYLLQMFANCLKSQMLRESFEQGANGQGILVSPLELDQNALNFLPKIYVAPNKDQAAKAAAWFADNYITNFSWGYLVCATGNTMIPVYEAMEAMGVGARIRNMLITHLDGYANLASPGDHGFGKFIQERVLDPFEIKASNTRLIDEFASSEHDIDSEIADLIGMHNALSRGGAPGLCFDGIGPSADPHVAFIPKNADWSDIVAKYKLDEAVINRDFKDRGQPYQDTAISMGLTAILRVPHMMMVAYGADKGLSLAASLTPEFERSRVASALSLGAGRTVIIIDQEAANVLREAVSRQTWPDTN